MFAYKEKKENLLRNFMVFSEFIFRIPQGPQKLFYFVSSQSRSQVMVNRGLGENAIITPVIPNAAIEPPEKLKITLNLVKISERGYILTRITNILSCIYLLISYISTKDHTIEQGLGYCHSGRFLV